MAKTESNNFEVYRSAAQYFTMTAAVLYVLLWAIVSITNSQSATTDKLGNVLITATLIGGVIMGLMYLVHLYRKK